MAVANRKERQYQLAITSNAICTFEFNLTQDRIERDILRETDEGAGIAAWQGGSERPMQDIRVVSAVGKVCHA